jgi:NADH-quinone oxidoreductase subunit M
MTSNEPLHWLTLAADMLPFLATISPLIGASGVAVASRLNPAFARPTAYSNALLTLLLLGAAVWHYEPNRVDQRGRAGASPMEMSSSWLLESSVAETAQSHQFRRGSGVRLSFGLDGLTLWPALWLALAAWAAVAVPGSRAVEPSFSYYIALLLGQSCLLASLTSRDVVVSLIALEASLPSLYFLIGRWGGQERRTAAGRFLICQVAGCALTLVGMTLIVVSWPWVRSDFDARRSPLFFDTWGLVGGIQSMVDRNEVAVQLWSDLAPWGSMLLILGFAIRLPAFPFQEWYATTLKEGPAGIAGLVAIALPQVTFCGWVRFAMPLFVEQAVELSWWLGVVASLGALYAGLRSISQSTLRELAAAMSTGWLALALLAMRLPSRDGLAGAWLLIQSQGLSVAGLIWFSGMLESRFGDRETGTLEGMAFLRPRLATMLIAWLVGSGVMGCVSTAGSFLALSTLTSESAAFAACGIAASLLLTWSMFAATQRILFGRGPSSRDADHLAHCYEPTARFASVAVDRRTGSNESKGQGDLAPHEIVVLAPFILLLVWITLAPEFVIERGESTLSHLLERIERRAEAMTPSAPGPTELRP